MDANLLETSPRLDRPSHIVNNVSFPQPYRHIPFRPDIPEPSSTIVVFVCDYIRVCVYVFWITLQHCSGELKRLVLNQYARLRVQSPLYNGSPNWRHVPSVVFARGRVGSVVQLSRFGSAALLAQDVMMRCGPSRRSES